MKITAPISRTEEVEIMIGCGADELYCGVVPSRWMQRFTRALWLNRRDPLGGNLANEEDFASAVAKAHALGASVFFTLNAPYFTAGQQEVAVELAEWAVDEAGVDAVILADVGLIRALAGRLAGRAQLHVSTVANAANREAVAHWADLGAGRVILPRYLSLDEIRRLVEQTDGAVELEAFVLNDTCVYDEGFCQTVHGVEGLGAFCMTPWEYEVHPAPGGTELADSAEWERHLADHRRWLWYCNSCGCTMSNRGLPLGPCGLCALHELDRAGVTAVKIVGREASTMRKLRSVQLVKRVLEKVEAGADTGEVSDWARRLRATPEHCSAGYMCYYRETAPTPETAASVRADRGPAVSNAGGGRTQDSR